MDPRWLYRRFRVDGVASSHQGDRRHGEYAGSQCLSVCVMYLATSYYNDSKPVTRKEDLDEVLRLGTQLDSMLRKSGRIGRQQFAQLSDIPGVLETHNWTCSIYTSLELFGLIAQESIINEPFVMSLRTMLERNYHNVPQFILFICNSRAGAVLLRDGRYYLFDPHNVPMLPDSPAHVISTMDSVDILRYVGPPDAEYTGCQLYFIPTQYEHMSPQRFILHNYRVLMSRPPNSFRISLTGLSCVTDDDEENYHTLPHNPCGNNHAVEPTAVESNLEVVPQISSSKGGHIVALDNSAQTQDLHQTSPIIAPVSPTVLPSSQFTTSSTLQHPKSPSSMETPASQQTSSPQLKQKQDEFKSSPCDNLQKSLQVLEAVIDGDATNNEATHTSHVSECMISSNATETSSECNNGTTSPIQRHLQQPPPMVISAGADELLHDLQLSGKRKRRQSDDASATSISTEPDRPLLLQHANIGSSTVPISEVGLPQVPQCSTQPHITANDYHNNSDDCDSPTLPTLPNATEYMRLEFNSTFEDEIDFCAIDMALDRLESNTHIQGHPIIYDMVSDRPIRESVALMALDRMIYSIVVEHGLVSSSDNGVASPALNVLRFAVLWARKLSAPTGGLESMLSTNLRLDAVYHAAVLDRILDDTKLGSHVRAKLTPCLSHMYNETENVVGTLVAEFRSAMRADQLRETPLNLSTELLNMLNSGAPCGYVVATRAELDRLICTGIEWRNMALARNSLIATDGEYFQQLLECISQFMPPPLPAHAMTVAVEKKMQILACHCARVASALTAEAEGLLLTLIESLEAVADSNTTMLYTSPDFNTTLMRIKLTITTITFCESDLGLGSDDLLTCNSQLLCLGSKIATLCNSDWTPFVPSDVTAPPSIVNALERIATLNRNAVNRQMVDAILDDIEAILADEPRCANGGTVASTRDLETYVANAGALVGPADHPRFNKLRTAVLQLSTTENAIVSTLQCTSLKDLPTSVPRLLQMIASNERLAHSDVVRGALVHCAMSAVSDVVTVLTSNDGNAPTVDEMLALRTFADRIFNEDVTNAVNVVTTAVRAVEAVKLAYECMNDCGRDRGGVSCNDLWKVASDDVVRAKETLRESSVDRGTRRQLAKVLRNLSCKCVHGTSICVSSPIDSGADGTLPHNSSNVSDQFSASYNCEPNGQENMDEETEMHQVITDNSDDPQSIQETMQCCGKEAWAKVRTAFKNLTFATVSTNDWVAIWAECMHSDTRFPETIGTELPRLLEDLSDTVRNLRNQRVLSLLPGGRTFIEPDLQWLRAYEGHVQFSLRTCELPRVVAHATTLSTDIAALWQALSATSVQEATVGTDLETHTTTTLELLRSMDATATLRRTTATAQSAEFMCKIRSHDNMAPPTAPAISEPKTFFDAKGRAVADTLPQMFRDVLKESECMLLADVKDELCQIRESMEAARARFVEDREQTHKQFTDVMRGLLTNAPNTIRESQSAAAGAPMRDPLTFLESVLTDAGIMQRAPYRDVLQCAQWVRHAACALLPACPHWVKDQLLCVIDHAERTVVRFDGLVNLEVRASQTDDANVLEHALSTLESSRVTGGRATTNAWSKRRDELRTLEAAIGLAGTVRADLDIVAGLAQTTSSTVELHGLATRASSLMGALVQHNGATIQDTDVRLRGFLEEVMAYITHKVAFFEHYEREQPDVFSTYPLWQVLSRPLVLPVRSGQALTATHASRIAALLASQRGNSQIRTSHLKYNGPWVEVTPTVDEARPSYVPINDGPPLHRVPAYANFLEARLLQCCDNPYVCNVDAETCGILPAVAHGRLGVVVACLVAGQWKEMLRHGGDALRAYVDHSLHLTSLSHNEFLAMCVMVHQARLAASELHVRHNTAMELVILTHRQWILLTLAMWPHVYAAVLRLPSFADGIELLAAAMPGMRESLTDATLEVHYGPTQCCTPTPPVGAPSAFIMCPQRWTKTSAAALFWEAEPFLSFCAGSPTRARISFLTWALLALDPVVIQQIWTSLKPPAYDTPSALLCELRRLEFGIMPHVHLSHSVAPPCPGYSYGVPTGATLTIDATQPRDHIGDAVCISAFELALGALLLGTPLQIFATIQEPLMQHDSLGAIIVASPILDCTGHVEPFRTMKQTGLRGPGLDGAQWLPDDVGCGDDAELMVFHRQCLWLHALTLQRRMPHDDHHVTFNGMAAIALIDCNNTLINCYIAPSKGFALHKPIQFMVRDEQDGWPYDVLSSWHRVAEQVEDIHLAVTIQNATEEVTEHNFFEKLPRKLRNDDSTGPSSTTTTPHRSRSPSPDILQSPHLSPTSPTIAQQLPITQVFQPTPQSVTVRVSPKPSPHPRAPLSTLVNV
uniref:Large tegument protein n=1 Tax=Otarine gammaherpesvirus 4 TaxID=2801541 RepID=A0A8B6T2V6_9GAMA|nr:Large tegument protein [Otarine gammaherpesvirus 4]